MQALASCVAGLATGLVLAADPPAPLPSPVHRFQARSAAQAQRWQTTARETLARLLFGGSVPARVPLDPQVLRRIPVPAGGHVLEELSLASLPDRRVHAWLARPDPTHEPVGAVLALHGHGGTGEQIVKGTGPYWYGRALAEMGWVVISPDIGQHELQHTNWSLMGERVWDALVCVDHLVTRPEVDPGRLVVAGLSLGGETTMYVAALDTRLKAACSSGWLTTVANMKRGHCPCWQFPGLEANFDFADIFACVAPRPLVFELGEKERAPGGFPVAIGRDAFAHVKRAYRTFGAENDVTLTVHPGGHVFLGQDFWPVARAALDPAWPWTRNRDGTPEELLRRGEIARRCFARALGVLDGWWQARDPATGLVPRRIDQAVWAPNDNGADLFPFLALTAWALAPERLDTVLETLPRERNLTTRWQGLPDWFNLTNRTFLYPTLDTNRLVFCAAEYCKDGLLPMTEAMGQGPWIPRLRELLDAIVATAPVPTDWGPIPANDTEVNGELLQAFCRTWFMTAHPPYLEMALRIADAYCLEVLPGAGFIPPYRWDFQAHRPLANTFSLNDHGNEIVGGLSELAVAVQTADPARAARYRAALERMAQTLLAHARNADGFWVQRIEPTTCKTLDAATPDTWGYALAGIDTLARVWRESFGRQSVRQALRHLDRPPYLNWQGADSYADSIEGGLLLLNRYPEKAGALWLDRILPIFLGKQGPTGVVEGWYGDGNYARTALMAGWYHTQGTRCLPWHPQLRWGAQRRGSMLRVILESATNWSGRLVFDQPRHRLHFRLPFNYPRLNEFPEWFTVDATIPYQVQTDQTPPAVHSGADLAAGLPISLRAGQPLLLTVRPAARGDANRIP